MTEQKVLGYEELTKLINSTSMSINELEACKGTDLRYNHEDGKYYIDCPIKKDPVKVRAKEKRLKFVLEVFANAGDNYLKMGYTRMFDNRLKSKVDQLYQYIPF